MKSAITVRSFRRADTKQPVRAGARIEASAAYIDDLARVGLVREVAAVRVPETKVVPRRAAGVAPQSSASPAAPASPETTASGYARGARRRRIEPSS